MQNRTARKKWPSEKNRFNAKTGYVVPRIEVAKENRLKTQHSGTCVI